MYRIVKGTFDRVFALVVFIILLPVFIIVTLFLFITNSGKPFFIQKRPGKNGKIFKIIKFKTMNDKTDKNGKLLPDEYRLTFIGKNIRKLSLDEIPQLMNVLKGDMSLVGPRPLLPEYLPLYNEFQMQRHNVKPGITGWAQVNGRNAISWEQKFEYDVWYVNNLSFFLDLRILLKTLYKIINKEGISSKNSLTSEKFTSN
ncbi:MAG: UDP-galactose phosphate transferase [Bacteroidetes bacterium GWC2_33_15]|nr:MAG: UDP-galactose phosphate transferase [Bacteroidetes bacterium GWA2_33_15]OFX52190.1 MAG: UDP-galactose phosphate transferase [Bacteroidetes bacterium GWC2_33_15]OFX64344.1 MAG: UDP-galactose phosphate transferase [Bacteroidetes bacterium GWB2_32_14]OFX67749.1 MAG: UDP-galactose phosphate transferase [Bacteroidetes bacterium GWD2_33_33]HAN19361.1 lipid carrier--UDP-N-acetylgalactosaminyltransferase [Bacteroidales bacterium]